MNTQSTIENIFFRCDGLPLSITLACVDSYYKLTK